MILYLNDSVISKCGSYISVDGHWSPWEVLGCSTTHPSTRQRFIRKCNPAVFDNGAYRCPPDGNAEEKEEDCPISSPVSVCYAAYNGICGCSKDSFWGDVWKSSGNVYGDGTTQGSCATGQLCHSDGQCRDVGNGYENKSNLSVFLLAY